MNLATIVVFTVSVLSVWQTLAVQSGTPAREVPIWCKEVLGGPASPRRGGTPHIVPLDSNRAGVAFLNDGQLVVYEVDHDTSQLSSRISPGISSPFRLRLSLLDADSGKPALNKDWGTRVHDSAIQVTTGGVLVKTGEIARLYTPDFAKSHDLTAPPDNGSYLVTSVSPTGQTIMANRISQKLNLSHFDVFDASALKVRYSWNQSPPLYHTYSISDRGIAAADFNNHSIVVSEFGSNKWTTVGEPSGLCASMNMPTLYNDQQLAYGCDKLIVTSTDGHVLMTDSFPSGDTSSGKTTVAQGGRFIAVSLDTKKIKKHLLTEPSVRITATRIAVYDLTLKKHVLTVSVEPLPKNDYDFALSPGGSKLAILNDRNVSVYSVPVEPEKTDTVDPKDGTPIPATKPKL
jgi:hypothetical protein